jgi:hypothetical protein
LDTRGTIVEGYYHYHQQPIALREQLGDDGSQHSPILGFAHDGIPIYGPYAYANTNGTGEIVRMESSYRLRSITQRTSLPDGTLLPANLYGPNVNGTYPLGYFAEDFEYVEGLGDLDEYNGRFAVTPEYPGGVYAYYTTIDAFGDAAYPYLLGPQYYGAPLMDNVTGTVSIPGNVTSYDLMDEAEELRDTLASSGNADSGYDYAAATGVVPLTQAQFVLLDADGDGTLSLEDLLTRTSGTPENSTAVFVDFSNNASGQSGTLGNPFDTLTEADAFILHGLSSTIYLFGPQTTAEIIMLDEAMTLEALGGTVRIGDSTP